MKLSSSKSRNPSRYRAKPSTRELQSTQGKQKTPNTRRAQKTQKKPNILLTVVLSVLAVLGICLFIVSLVARSFGVGFIIRNTDVLGLLEDFSTGEHSYYIVDQVNNLPFSETEVTLYDIEEFIKLESVTNEIDRIINSYATAMMLGNLNHHVTVDDIIISARNIESELHDFFDHHMTEDDFSRLAQTLDDILDFNSLTLEGLLQDFDIDMSPLPLMLLSPVFLWVVGLLSTGILIVLFIIHKKNIAGAIQSVGIPVSLSGLVTYAAGAFVGSRFEIADGEPIGLTHFLEEPVHLLIQLGLITAAIGVVIVIVSLVVRLVRR
jgi:hypothetical protein